MKTIYEDEFLAQSKYANYEKGKSPINYSYAKQIIFNLSALNNTTENCGSLRVIYPICKKLFFFTKYHKLFNFVNIVYS